MTPALLGAVWSKMGGGDPALEVDGFDGGLNRSSNDARADERCSPIAIAIARELELLPARV